MALHIGKSLIIIALGTPAAANAESTGSIDPFDPWHITIAICIIGAIILFGFIYQLSRIND